MTTNVLGTPLELCSSDPLTGFFRDGCCNTCAEDVGQHTVCVEVNEAFLLYSREQGNDLITPRPEFGFPGLLPGDRWCVCLGRWLEACENGAGAPILLRSTHSAVADDVPLEYLEARAVHDG